MATFKYYLDSRKTGWEKPAPLKITIRHRNKVTHIPVGVSLLPEQWDDPIRKVTNHPRVSQLNALLNRRYSDVECELLSLQESGRLHTMTIHEVRDAIMGMMYPTQEVDTSRLFISRFMRFADLKTNARTKEIYTTTISRIRAYARNCDQLTFEDIDKGWLNGFDAYLAKTAPSVNARSIHMRNIRAVFNDAIDDEITQHYPFRKYKIKRAVTPKRSLSVEELRELFAYPVEEYQRKYLDIFKITFMLIGINICDLCHLKGIKGGRVEYIRAKTHRFYSIKVEREAMEIIERYKGDRWLLNILDTYGNYKDYAKHLNEALQAIGEVEVGKQGRKVIKPLHPDLTTYWARHTWATIAASLDIPKETIAAALGHGGNTITDIYIDFDQRKVDIANRRVLDYVLYGKF